MSQMTSHELRAVVLIITLTFVCAAPALAVDITYCVRIQFLPDYTDCPSGVHSGAQRWPINCSTSVYRNLPGLEITLFDRDSGDVSNDDEIDTFVLDYPDSLAGYSCATFPWDPVAAGETWPDVYPVTWWIARQQGNPASRATKLCDEWAPSSWSDDCDVPSVLTFRNYANTDCGSSGSACYNTLFISTSAASDLNRRAMILNSAQIFEETFGTDPRREGDLVYGVHPTGTTCLTCNFTRYWNSAQLYDTTNLRRWEVNAHEAGHAFMKQLFSGTGRYANACPSPHYTWEAYNNNCATHEGWATYVSIVSWWFVNNTLARPRAFGYAYEDGSNLSSNCTTNSASERMVTKTFWDLDDAHQDSAILPYVGTDSTNLATGSSISQTWQNFPTGCGNHQDDEGTAPGCVSDEKLSFNSINLWDYYWNGSTGTQSGLTNVRQVNGTSCQTDTSP